MKATEYARTQYQSPAEAGLRDVTRSLNELVLRYIDETIREVKQLRSESSQASKLKEHNRKWQAIAREIHKLHFSDMIAGESFFEGAQQLYEKNVISFVSMSLYALAFKGPAAATQFSAHQGQIRYSAYGDDVGSRSLYM